MGRISILILRGISFGLLLFFCSYISVKIAGIVTFNNEPLEGVIIKQQATTIADTSDALGQFYVDIGEHKDPITLTAWKDSFYISGLSVLDGIDNIALALERIDHDDNIDYQWIHPDSLADPESCVNCHAEIVQQWSMNLHSKAAKDPLVMNMYNGTDALGNQGVYPGYKLDFPNSDGSCANCHAPTAALKHGSWLTDLNEVSGVDQYGVHCDYCHKISDVIPDYLGSKPGYLSNILWRPYPGRQLFLGPFIDSPGDDTYLPVYENSFYCAGCHNYYNNNTPIYTSYHEWATSSYPARGIECQDCHMEPNGTTTNFAPGKGGAERHPGTIPSHNQMGENLEEFLSQSVEMVVDTLINDSILTIRVKLINDSTGHHFPTGNPMRNAILIVRAYDLEKQSLEYLGSDSVPAWGGEGDEKNDYAGQPGKGLARILKDFQGNFPAPQWMLTFVHSDTRIPADGIDSSDYEFLIPEDLIVASVDVRLIYRKSFKELNDLKKWNLKDYLVASDSFTIRIRDSEVSVSPEGLKKEKLTGLYVYPIPCQSYLNIDFSIIERTYLEIQVISVNGQVVRKLLSQMMTPGDHSITWNLESDNGLACESGTYYVIFRSDHFVETRKIVLIK